MIPVESGDQMKMRMPNSLASSLANINADIEAVRTDFLDQSFSFGI